MDDKSEMRARQKRQLDGFVEQTGLTLTALAAAAGISPSTLTRFYNSTEHRHILSATTFMKIAAAVAHRVEIGTDRRDVAETFDARDMSVYAKPLNEPYGEPARHVPVLGGAVGGSDGEFMMNGQVNEYVLAPPALSRVVGSYAIYTWGESMAPKYEEGQLLYVHPTRPPRARDYVVVQLHDDTALIKRLVSASSATVRLEQFNPAGIIEIPRNLVKAIHTVMLADERL